MTLVTRASLKKSQVIVVRPGKSSCVIAQVMYVTVKSYKTLIIYLPRSHNKGECVNMMLR